MQCHFRRTVRGFRHGRRIGRLRLSGCGLNRSNGGHGCARCAEFRQRENRVFEHGRVLGGRTERKRGGWLSHPTRTCAVGRPAGIDAPPVPSRPASRTLRFKVVAFRRASGSSARDNHSSSALPQPICQKDIGSENVWPSHGHGRDKLKILEYSFMNVRAVFPDPTRRHRVLRSCPQFYA
ncbi:hypothetical protein D3C72_1412930 [compost metagenome]